MSRRIETHTIAGPAGRLEALLEEPEHGEPREAALVCHPHPRHGGTMHNKVVYRIARGLRHAGAVVLRFNFRGVNLSEGIYDHGHGEADDAAAALAWLRRQYPALPYTLAGFSFGSRVVLRLGCRDRGARRLIVVGFPLVYRETAELRFCPLRRIFVHSNRDQFAAQPDFQALYDSLPPPKELHWVDSQNHFFSGALDHFESVIHGLG